MHRQIPIQIENKVATWLGEKPIVCVNSDYKVSFTFDDEWEEHSVKTARFKANGEYTDVVFEGSVCDVPVVRDARVLKVGVFAGDLSTSTPALVPCEPSILDGDYIPAPPIDDVYNQIIDICNDTKTIADDVKTRADNGEFDGKDGSTLEIVETEEGVAITVITKVDNINGDVSGPDGVGSDGGAIFEETYYINHGKDYVLTDTDKQEIADIINASIVDGNGVAY